MDTICLLFLLFALLFASSDGSYLKEKRWAYLNITSRISDEIKDFYSKKNIILADSALYGTESSYRVVSGRLMAVKSRSLTKYGSNKLARRIDSFGCTDYLNADRPDSFIALVSRGDCSFDHKINVAIRNNASAIIIHNNDQDVFTMFTDTSELKHFYFYQTYLSDSDVDFFGFFNGSKLKNHAKILISS